MSLYSKLYLCNHLVTGQSWAWWSFASHFPQYTWKCRKCRKCRNLIRLLVGEHCLATNAGWRNSTHINSKMCNMCNKYFAEDVPHLLFECTRVESELERIWVALQFVAPDSLVCEMKKMCPLELTAFWLSEFKSRYIHEWRETYAVVCNYIHDTCTTRRIADELSIAQ